MASPTYARPRARRQPTGRRGGGLCPKPGEWEGRQGGARQRQRRTLRHGLCDSHCDARLPAQRSVPLTSSHSSTCYLAYRRRAQFPYCRCGRGYANNPYDLVLSSQKQLVREGRGVQWGSFFANPNQPRRAGLLPSILPRKQTEHTVAAGESCWGCWLASIVL